MNIAELEAQLCKTLCGAVHVRSSGNALWRVETPWTFPDGDTYSIYISPAPTGGLRVSDQGLTMMQLSYENDLAKFREGTRGKLLAQIVADVGMSEDDGEFYLDTTLDDLGATIMRLGQALTRVHDVTFLNRIRAENTFYEDLREKLHSIVGAERLTENYVVPDIARAGDYPVDYLISGGNAPLYLFGVPNRDKARLATIILQHLNAANVDFRSMIVYQNMVDVPRIDVSRLTNAANDAIASLDATEDFERKLLRQR